MQFVLEQVLQREARQNLGLRQGGGQDARDDDERGINEGSVGSGGGYFERPVRYGSSSGCA